MAATGITAMQQRNGAAAPALLACAVALLALPSAVLAFSSRYEDMPGGEASKSALQTIVPGKMDPRLARSIAVRALAKGQLFRFTPAATPLRPERVVTVAVQFDPSRGRSILVRAPSGGENPAPVASSMGIAPMAYNLGVARDYKSFAPTGGGKSGKLDIPDLGAFTVKPSAQGGDPRIAPRIVLDERANVGRAPRTFEGDGEQTVDLGGSYRVGRNLNVTAGVRYSQERDRLRPVDANKKDDQAVYVGTQFRF